MLGLLVLLFIIIGAGIYAYYLYQERPRPQRELYGVKLGVLPVEAKLVLGEPVLEEERENKETGGKDLIQIYKEYQWDSAYKYIRFINQEGEFRALQICDSKLDNEPFDIYSWTTTEDVVNKLGIPSHESIRADGLRKMLTFEKYNVAIEFEKNKVVTFCVTNDDTVTYVEEYDPK